MLCPNKTAKTEPPNLLRGRAILFTGPDGRYGSPRPTHQAHYPEAHLRSLAAIFKKKKTKQLLVVIFQTASSY
jgi:hypothetical protein